MSKAFVAGIELTAVELLGDTSLRQYALTGDTTYLFLGSASYLTLVYILQDALKTESLAITNGFWDGLSNIVTTATAVALGENLSTKQIIGLLLISGGLFLL